MENWDPLEHWALVKRPSSVEQEEVPILNAQKVIMRRSQEVSQFSPLRSETFQCFLPAMIGSPQS